MFISRNKHTMRQLYRPSAIFRNKTEEKDNTGVTDTGCKSQRLMTDLGLIHGSSAGTHHLLPIALKSLEKLNAIINYFMKTIDAQKLQMPTLTSSSLWTKTGRLEECTGELMKVTDRHSKEYILSPTHEESICHMLSSSQISHKQLPLRLYQITNKFRDELRPKYGLLRGREFLMKDLYTFDQNEENAVKTYFEVNAAYEALFNYIGVNWIKAIGSAGTIGGKTTHEFHFPSPAGEDFVLNCNSCGEKFNKEVAKIDCDQSKDVVSESSDPASIYKCPTCESNQVTGRPAIEVGHSFLLGQKYTRPLNTTFINSSGKPQLLEMGCYGLGVSRILASVIEVLSTDTDIRWPLALAPYLIAIIPPKSGSKEEKYGKDIMNALETYFDKNLPNDVILDDRSEFTIGRRFVDLKMLGVPYVIVIGKRVLEQPRIIELHDVYKGTTIDLTWDEIFNYCYDLKSKWKLI